MNGVCNSIQSGDCIPGMKGLEAGSVDLTFADPPFNIGYEYDVYDDKREHEHYLDWSREWISEVFRVLKSDGTFWLAIGDEYAAELKLISQEIGFHCRSWVIWYYTFGVNCAHKFSRSHAHLFHLVKDAERFTFRDDDLDNRIPSARQLVYNDKRANPKGRLPDDTWMIRPSDVVGEMLDDAGRWSPEDLQISADENQTWTLRPQDIDQCFSASEDTWYFPRVAGTFKERAGFHGCQMPEQLLARIIRFCSHPDDVVLDPFSGSATTLVVAKKLARRYLGFELSEDYAVYGRERLAEVRVGDPLEGSPEPTMSAPKTSVGRRGQQSRPGSGPKPIVDAEAKEKLFQESQLALTLHGIREAFRLTHQGFSADRVVADPTFNDDFASACRRLGLAGDVRTWNILLFRLRKSGQLSDFETTRTTQLTWEECDPYLFASEIALQSLLDDEVASGLDEVLCDPHLVQEFDKRAQRLAPGFTSLNYRWAALKLRKQAKTARIRGAVLTVPSKLGRAIPISELDAELLPAGPGAYLLHEAGKKTLYVGEALHMRTRLEKQFAAAPELVWQEFSENLQFQSFSTQTTPAEMLAWQSCLVRKFQPRLNFRELNTAG